MSGAVYSISYDTLIGPSFFQENTITGYSYLDDIFENYDNPQ